MVYDFDGLGQSAPDMGESIWTISGSEVEIELEDRPALIRGRARSDGLTRNERRPRSLSASGRRIASAVAKLVVKPKKDGESENEEKSVVELETSIKSQSIFRQGSKQQTKVEEGELRQHDKEEIEKSPFGNNQATSSVNAEEKSEKTRVAGSVVNMIGRVLSPKKLPRKKVIGTPAMIDGNRGSPPESPRSPEQPSRAGAVASNSPFLGNFIEGESSKYLDSPSKDAPRMVSPLKAFGHRAFGGLMRHQVSGKTDTTGDEYEMACSVALPPLTASPEKQQPAGILRASSHRPVRRPSIESGSISYRNLEEQSLEEKKAALGNSEHGTRSTLLIDHDDSSGKYSRTVSSLVSPRRKMVSRKLDSTEILQRAKARRQSGTGSSSDTKRRGSSRSRLSQTSSDTREKPKRRFSESSGNTSASRLTTQTCGPLLHSESNRPNRESSRGRPRRSLETRSDHVSTTRRRASSAFPTTSSEARGKPQRRFSETSGNTATSKLTTKTCRTTPHEERMQSRRQSSRGRPRKSLETRSDHLSTTSRSSSSRHSRKLSEVRGKADRRYSEGSSSSVPSTMTKPSDKKQLSDRTLPNKESSLASARTLQEVSSNYMSTHEPNSERSRTSSRKKSSSNNLKASPPGSTEEKEGSSRMERRVISNRSTTPSRTQSSLMDSKRQKEGTKVESKSNRSTSGQRTTQKSVHSRTSNSKDVRSSSKDKELATEVEMISGDSHDKGKQHVRANASNSRSKTTGSEMDKVAPKSETSNNIAEHDVNGFTLFYTEDFP